jgi:hypothetical protein
MPTIFILPSKILQLPAVIDNHYFPRDCDKPMTNKKVAPTAQTSGRNNFMCIKIYSFVN